MHIKIDLKIFLFTIIFILSKSIKIYSILMIFAFIHELGHLICGLILGFKPKKISIMPYGIELNFNINYSDYNRKIKKGNIVSLKKLLIALAGPLTNLIILLITVILKNNNIEIDFYGYTSEQIIYSNLIIGLFNLIPIYPLDGGKIMYELSHIGLGLRKTYTFMQNISLISISILSLFTSIIIICYNNIGILITLLYLWIMVIKSEKELSVKKKIYEYLLIYNVTIHGRFIS